MPFIKLTISPGQALLLLIDHYKNDTSKLNELKKLYLSGPQNHDDFDKIQSLFSHRILSSYQIDFDPMTISEDATRRYFETHLAYESLAHGLDKINISDLKQHVDNLYGLLCAGDKYEIEHVLQGEVRLSDPVVYKEYSDYLKKLRTKQLFPQFSDEQREKIELLVKSSFLGVANAWYNILPLDIYDTGIYSETERGRLILDEQDSTRSQNLGLIKSSMPIALDDIARSQDDIPYLKPADQASFIENTQWVQANFDKMVHPFSNSISGTMLCQLRANAKLKGADQGVFTHSGEQMQTFIQLLASSMTFYSGGHTLYEFIAPLSLAAVRNEFSSTSGFEQLNLESTYLTGNETAFDAALKDTLEYNKIFLMRQLLHSQMKLIQQERNKIIKHLEFLKGFSVNQKTTICFGLFTRRFEKRLLIQDAFTQTIRFIERGDLKSAIQEITDCRQKLIQKYGKTNFWGNKSSSLKLLELAEKTLDSESSKNLYFPLMKTSQQEDIQEPHEPIKSRPGNMR